MPIVVECKCGRSFTTSEANLGKRGKCPSCGSIVEVCAPMPEVSRSLADPVNELAASVSEVQPLDYPALRTELSELINALHHLTQQLQAPPQATAPSQKEYKVLTQKDKWFSGKFDPEKIEQALNAYASQGWAFRGITTASIPGFAGTRDEIVIVLER